MAKYAELFDGARVIFNKDDRSFFDLRDAAATVVDISPVEEPTGCVAIKLDEAPAEEKLYGLAEFDTDTLTFVSHADHLTLVAPQELLEIDSLADLV